MVTEDEKLQMALAAFKRSNRTPGQALSPFDFIDIAAKNSWRNLDVLDGVKAGFAKGFFDDGPNYGIQLTSAGFAAIAALNETVQTALRPAHLAIMSDQHRQPFPDGLIQ